MTIDLCKTCRFFHLDSPLASRGQCWHGPPVVFSSGQVMRPPVSGDCGCGQHEPDPVPVAPERLLSPAVAADAKSAVEHAVVNGTAKRSEEHATSRLREKRAKGGY